MATIEAVTHIVNLLDKAIILNISHRYCLVRPCCSFTTALHTQWTPRKTVVRLQSVNCLKPKIVNITFIFVSSRGAR